MATWTINSITIFVQAAPEEGSQIIARLQPLSGGSVHQVFGYEKQKINLQGLVVGSTDIAAIKALSTTGTTVSLVSPFGNRTVYVEEISVSPTLTVSQTIRTDLACTATVYEVDLGLLEA